jgi:hypothetical protein
MATIAVEQALFYRRENEGPRLQARSPGFADDWLAEAERLIAGFGDRPFGVACPLAVFAQPLGRRHVAVVRVADQPDAGQGRFLAYHFLVLDRPGYERFVADPFVLAERLPAVWQAGEPLPALAWPAEPPPARTVDQVQPVLKRVKAAALREDEDPEHPVFERTVANSESPALLGGAQVLVDGGRLLFERPAGDLALLSGLWLLLPHTTRCRRWPASFAFANDHGFDAVALPRVRPEDVEGYTTEEQAADYPPGSYELALQVAAESGNQRDLDAVFVRRNSGEVIRLALTLIAALVVIVGVGQWFGPAPDVDRARPYKLAAAAGVVGAGDPWTAAALIEHGDRLFRPKAPPAP